MAGPSARLAARLSKAFQPESLEIVDESHLHAGHQQNFDGGGETHLRVRITAATFSGMGRLERHRAINAVAQEELADGLHALAIEARAPGEAGR